MIDMPPYELDLPTYGIMGDNVVYKCNGCEQECRVVFRKGCKPPVKNLCNIEGRTRDTILEWTYAEPKYIPLKPGEGKDPYG